MFQIATIPRLDLNTELFVVFVQEKFVKQRNKSYTDFPEEVHAPLQDLFALRDFKGKLFKTRLIYPQKKNGIKRIFIVGTGDQKKLSCDDFRNLGKLIADKQEELSVKRVHLFLANIKGFREDFIRCFSEGILFQKYHFEQHKSEKPTKRKNGRFIFLCNRKEYTPRFRQILLETESIMNGVSITRDLANQPSNHLTPHALKNYVLKHFKNTRNIQTTILDESAMRQKKFGALLSVSKGSAEPPYLIIMHYKPVKKTSKRLVLVGKGVTFDSGGISIKPSANMEEMKFDMCGAAAVVGSMDVISHFKPKFEVIALLPAVENMPGGKATKPGDVVTAYNGKTIEIINTDAEGRLILADALAYAAKEYKPKIILDFATLTGACVVALGDKNAGIFSNSEKLAHLLKERGVFSGDQVWPMPMDDDYKKELESETADLKNIGSRWGGAITAAKFLEHFVEEITWAHIDIAGTSYDVKNKDYLGKGATGFGTRLIGRSLKQLEKII